MALKDGSVANQGSLSTVLARDTGLLAELNKDEAEADVKEVAEEEAQKQAADEQADGKLVLKEEISEGHVGWSAREFNN